MLRCQVAPGELAGRAQADDLQHVLGAGPAAALVARAVDQRRQRHARRGRRARRPPWARRACARPPTAGPRPARPRRPGSCPRDWAASVCNSAPCAVGDLGQLGDGLDRAHLVVGVHDRHQQRVGRDGRSRSAGSTSPSPSTGSTVRRKPWVSSQRQTSVTAGCSTAEVMMWLPRCPAGQGDALDGMVVALGAAAGEDHLVGLAAEQRRHLGAGGLDGALGRRAVGMAAGWIAKVLVEIGRHRLGHLGGDGRGGVVVEIDRFHACPPAWTLYHRLPRRGKGAIHGPADA